MSECAYIATFECCVKIHIMSLSYIYKCIIIKAWISRMLKYRGAYMGPRTLIIVTTWRGIWIEGGIRVSKILSGGVMNPYYMVNYRTWLDINHAPIWLLDLMKYGFNYKAIIWNESFMTFGGISPHTIINGLVGNRWHIVMCALRYELPH